jgi:hypothetical protein
MAFLLSAGVMHDRMTLENGKACDSGFGTELEDIMSEMEKNKDATEELAKKLNATFVV